MVAIIWLVLGIVMVGAEALSGDFFLLMLGVGALLGSGAAAIAGGAGSAAIALSVGVFAVASIGLIAGVRPAVKRKFAAGSITSSNVDALVGRSAYTVTAVTHTDGRVKIGGEVWSARTLHEEMQIDEGQPVTVVEISGATAVVLAK
ncbi:MAG: NfeD family protein [Sciscionella sp.]